MRGDSDLDMTATIAQPTPIPVHDVVRQRVHDVMRSCVLEVMRPDTRSREISCHRRDEIRCPRCCEITHRIAGAAVPTRRTRSADKPFLPHLLGVVVTPRGVLPSAMTPESRSPLV